MSADMARGVRTLDDVIVVEIHEEVMKLAGLCLPVRVDLLKAPRLLPRFELHSKDSPTVRLGEKTCAEHRLQFACRSENAEGRSFSFNQKHRIQQPATRPGACDPSADGNRKGLILCVIHLRSWYDCSC